MDPTLATLLERTTHIQEVVDEIRTEQKKDSDRIRHLEDKYLELKAYQRVVMGLVSFGSAILGFAINAWRN